LQGELQAAHFRPCGRFGLEIPTSVAGVRPTVLDPRTSWADPMRFDAQEGALAARFADNFRAYAAEVPSEVLDAGPR
jgi:phosphoenolpyruvate carboxykinase (ATP)